MAKIQIKNSFITSSAKITISSSGVVFNSAITASSLKLNSLISASSTGYVLGVDNTTGNIYKTAAGGGGSGTVSGTTNYIPKFTAANSIGNSAIYDNSGNIGIGTTSPSSKLAILGTNSTDGPNAYFTMNLLNTANAVSGVGSGLMFGTNIGTASGIYITGMAGIEGIKENGTNNDYASALKFTTRINGGNLTERMRIASDGRVGIGTTSPITGYLDVRSTAAKTATATNIAFFGSNDASNPLGLAVNHESSSGIKMVGLVGTEYGSSGNNIKINEILTVQYNNNVGIGTTTPTNKLEIVGGIHLNGNIRNPWSDYNWNVAQYPNNSDSSPTYYMGFSTDATNRRFYISNKNNDGAATDPNGGIIFRTGGTPSDRMVISYAGNVGIGTTSPQRSLDVNGSIRVASGGVVEFGGSITNYLAGNNSTNYISIGTNSSERFRIDSAGNVGIGTTSPSGLLTVYKGNNGGLGGHIVLDNNANVVDNETAVIFADGGTSFIRAAISSTTEASPYYGAIKFKTGASTYSGLTTRMIILGNGNVGIGTTSPAAKLDVAGNLRLGSALGNSHVITGSLNVGGGIFNNAISIDRMDYYQLQPYIEGANFPENALQLGGGTRPTFTTMTGSVCPFGKVAYNTSYYESIGDYIPVNPGETLYGEIWAYRSSGASGTAGAFYCGISRYDKDKNPIATNLGLTYFVASGVTVPTSSTWTKYSGTTTLPTTHTPYNGSDGGPVRYVRPYLIVNYPSGTIPTYWGGLKIRKTQVTRDTGVLSISGSLGIGTTSPSYKLDVSGGDVNIQSTRILRFGTVAVLNEASDPNDIYANIRVIRNKSSTTSDGMYIGYGNAGTTSGHLRFYANNQTERMRIDASSGYVGIGTTSPSSKLHVYDNGGSFRTDLESTYHMGMLNEYVSTYVTRTKFGRYESASTSNLEIYYDIANNEEARITRNLSTAVLKFNRSSTTDMIIDGSGNVGIGTSSPVSKLQVSGSSNLSILKLYRNAASATTPVCYAIEANGSPGKANVALFERLNNLATANISASSAGVRIREHSSNYAVSVEDHSGNSLFVVKGGGSVGIGTSSPTYTLQVNGSFGATTKSFIIKHPDPDKVGKYLTHGVTESPEHTVFVRGKLENKNVIELPDYWPYLVDSDTITVTLTPKNTYQQLYVADIVDNTIIINNNNNTAINCYYYVVAERKDIPKLVPEL